MNQRDAILATLQRYVPKTIAKTVLDRSWPLDDRRAITADMVDHVAADVMESLRVFCDKDHLSSLMVDLAEICSAAPSQKSVAKGNAREMRVPGKP